VSSTKIGHCKRVKVRGTEWPINNGQVSDTTNIRNKTQNKDKQNEKKTTQKTKTMSNWIAPNFCG
jgi:hypothetical protein